MLYGRSNEPRCTSKGRKGNSLEDTPKAARRHQRLGTTTDDGHQRLLRTRTDCPNDHADSAPLTERADGVGSDADVIQMIPMPAAARCDPLLARCRNRDRNTGA
jgi:hypothetical protein